MPAPAPAYCRLEAYELFAESVDRLETSQGLLQASVAIAMHEMEEVTPEQVDAEIQEIADTIRSRVAGQSTTALLAHTHDVLFDELGFHGNTSDYYDPDNSYLPAVMANKAGLPITLCLVYKLVVERLGIEVEGVNAPGHFMARVESAEGPMLVDAFDKGRVLSWDEACERASEAVQRSLPYSEDVLPVATHRQWIGRMLRNLYAVFLRRSRPDDLGAIVELGRLLRGGDDLAT